MPRSIPRGKIISIFSHPVLGGIIAGETDVHDHEARKSHSSGWGTEFGDRQDGYLTEPFHSSRGIWSIVANLS